MRADIMVAGGIWFATAETTGADISAITRFRESAMVDALDRLAGVQRLERYMAFNVARTALVASLNDAPTVSPDISSHPGIHSRALSARMCASFIQPGERDPIADSSILYSVLFKIPQEWHAEFDAWYDQEHVPMILSCREWAMTARYHVQDSPWTHLALHYIKSASAFDHEALKKARLTPWRKKFLEHHWFTNVDKTIHFRQAKPDT